VLRLHLLIFCVKISIALRILGPEGWKLGTLYAFIRKKFVICLRRRKLMSGMLVVSLKVKKFIQGKAQFNSSAEFLSELSRQVENICLEAIEKTRQDKRKTLKARDLS